MSGHLLPGARHHSFAFDGLQPMLGEAPIATDGPREDPPFLWDRAYRDALRALRSIPDPALFAASIDEHHREALRTAWRGQDGWRVHPAYLRELRLLGLAEVAGLEGELAHQRNHLTAFGIAVRRVVMEAL